MKLITGLKFPEVEGPRLRVQQGLSMMVIGCLLAAVPGLRNLRGNPSSASAPPAATDSIELVDFCVFWELIKSVRFCFVFFKIPESIRAVCRRLPSCGELTSCT